MRRAVRARRAPAVALLASLTAAGCFKYSTVDPAAVDPREEVRVQVTSDAAVRTGMSLGTIRENLEGRLTPAGSDSLVLSVWVGKDYRGTPFENSRQTVSLGVREVVQVRRRELSLPRTGLVAAGVLAVTAILIDRVAFDPNPNPGGGGRPGPPPDPDGFRIPIGR